MINNFSIFSSPERFIRFQKVYRPLFSFIYISDAFSTVEKYERRIEADLGIPRNTFQMNMMHAIITFYQKRSHVIRFHKHRLISTKINSAYFSWSYTTLID